MKIGYLSVASLHIMENFGYQEAVMRSLPDLPLKKEDVGYSPKLKRVAEAFETAFREFDDVINGTSGPTPAAVAKKIDRQRVKTWREMRAFARASMAFPDEEVAAVARRATHLFKIYGNMAQKAESGRSGRMKNLTDSLRNLGAEALEKAHLRGFLEKLERENEAHLEASDRRATADGKRVKGLVRTKRKAVDAAYHELIETVNALALMGDEEPYREFMVSMIGLISLTHTTLATRRTILAKRRATKRAAVEAERMVNGQ